MKIYAEVRTLGGSTFRGWLHEVKVTGSTTRFEFLNGRVVSVPDVRLDYFETLPEGHAAIPAWAVGQLGEK